MTSISSAHPRHLRLLGLGLLLFFLIGSVALSQESQRKSDSAAKQEDARKGKSDEPKSMAGQLAEETREAAGEEENAQFKNSWSIRKLAQYTHLSPEHAFWLAVALNFAVVAGAIIWAGKKFAPGFFRERTAAIQRAMEEARRASADARRRLAEIESRLSRLDVEIGEMRKHATKEAAAEEARILAAAEEDAHKIVASAELEIGAAVKQARRDLAAYAADLAISHAQSGIRVDADTDQSLIRGFAEQISASNSRPAPSASPKKGRG